MPRTARAEKVARELVMRVVPSSVFSVLSSQVATDSSTIVEEELSLQLYNMMEVIQDKAISSGKKMHVISSLGVRRHGGKEHEQGV